METYNSQRSTHGFNRGFFLPTATGSPKKNVEFTERAISAIAGIMIACWGIRKKNFTSLLATAASLPLLWRGISGYSHLNNKLGLNISYEDNAAIEVSTSLQINKPKQMLYRYWSRLENLPNFMDHLEEVIQTGDGISLWVAQIPGGLGEVKWEAEVTKEAQNYLIAWRSLPGSEIENTGEVKFQEAPNGRCTIVETTISYRPPAGDIKEYAACLFSPIFRRIVQEDLKNFKRFIESGEFEDEIYPLS